MFGGKFGRKFSKILHTAMWLKAGIKNSNSLPASFFRVENHASAHKKE